MTVTRHSPLQDREEAFAAVDGRLGPGGHLVERPFLTQLDLRLDPDAAGRLSDIGLAIPERPNSWLGSDPVTYWLGPEELLVVTDQEGGPALERKISQALHSTSHALVDVSDQRTVLALSGRDAGDLLAGGCPLDFHPETLIPGSCAQSLLGSAPVMIARTLAEMPSFDIFVRSSFAGYVADWLLDAVEAAAPSEMPELELIPETTANPGSPRR